MSYLRFFYGPMGAGKTTLLLQTVHNYRHAGKLVCLFTQKDRKGPGKISSRLGVDAAATELTLATSMLTAETLEADYVIVDEAQFLNPEHVSQIEKLVDDYNVNVDCYGLLTDFQGELFTSSAKLVTLADELVKLPVPVFCWCGTTATHNGRVIDGVLQKSGEQIQIGDTQNVTTTYYLPLCRKHWRNGKLAKSL